MSWASSRRYTRGDPGLFDVIGKAIGAVANVATGGLAGTIYNTAKTVLSGGAKRPAPAGPVAPFQLTQIGGTSLIRSQPITRSPIPQALLPKPITMPGGAVIIPDSVKVSGGGLMTPIGSIGGGSATAYFTQPGAPAGMVCGSNGKMRAAHLNRSGYFLKGGQYVAPGTKCVANRRRNPLNPRALSRAMSRVAGAQKAVRAIIRFESVSKGGKLRMKRPARRK